MTFPPGTFNQNTIITLTGHKPDSTFGMQQYSTSFALQIQAEMFCKPLTVSISGFSGTTQNQLVALGDVYLSAGVTDTGQMSLVPAQVVDGRLVFQVPPSAECESHSLEAVDETASGYKGLIIPITIKFQHVTSYCTVQSDNFVLSYPCEYASTKPTIPGLILSYAERAYALLEGMGFELAGRFQNNFPINISYSLGQRDGETVLPLSGKYYQYLNINGEKCDPLRLDPLQATIGHEFFHAVQNLYDPRGVIAIRHPASDPSFLWLAEASSTWFESRMLNSTTYVSPTFVTSIDMKSTGLESGGNRDVVQSLGYWASGFLRYLVGVYPSGDRFMLNLWNMVNLQTTKYSDLAALISTVGSSANTATHWREYLNDVMSGNTGYAGWPIPSNNTGWGSNSGFTGVVRASIAPFSGLKWPLRFNTVTENRTYFITSLTSSPYMSLELYRYKGAQQPFERVATLANNKPFALAVAPNDQYIVSVVNADTTSPYHFLTEAVLRIGLAGRPRFCTINDLIPMEIDGRNRVWRHPTLGYRLALEQMHDVREGELTYAECRDYDTGQLVDAYSWYYENGNNFREDHYLNALTHGVQKQWHDNGQLQYSLTYKEGVRHGLSLYYHYNGNLSVTSYYINGKANGDWVWYDESGAVLYTCTLVDDVPQPGCTYPWW
ncbi:MAG: hypothetical protein RDU30_00790 [Desulfovibrionaceae bacterium]|nr:hypothetical protein [Desulfovibrionaceae bacterium]